MHRLFFTLLILLLAAPAFAAEAPKTDEEKTLYAVGEIIHLQLAVFNLTPSELEIVKQGITDAAAGKGLVDIGAYQEKVQELAKARRKAQSEKLAAANKGFLEQAAREKGALKTDSGLIYQSLVEGTGSSPRPDDTIKANYRSTFPDGKEFDSSAKRGKPMEAKVDSLIKCLEEGIQKMKPGGKARMVCPPDIAYGDVGAGDAVPPGATLVFEVELLEVRK